MKCRIDLLLMSNGWTAWPHWQGQHDSLENYFLSALTGDLLKKQPTDYEEVIEKLFSTVCSLEDGAKIPDPQVDSTD